MTYQFKEIFYTLQGEAALHVRGFQIAVETNGSIAAPKGID